MRRIRVFCPFRMRVSTIHVNAPCACFTHALGAAVAGHLTQEEEDDDFRQLPSFVRSVGAEDIAIAIDTCAHVRLWVHLRTWRGMA